jgi:hypothetical protein
MGFLYCPGGERESVFGRIGAGVEGVHPAPMPPAESAIDRQELNRARALLRLPQEPVSAWPALGAAALMAISALTLAMAMIVAPS